MKRRKLQISRPMWLLLLVMLGVGTVVLAQSNTGVWSGYFNNITTVDDAVSAFKAAKDADVLPDACIENRGETLTIKAQPEGTVGLIALCNNAGSTVYYGAKFTGGAWQYRQWYAIDPQNDIYDNRAGDVWQVRNSQGAYILLPVEQMIAPSPTPMPTLGPATFTPAPTAVRNTVSWTVPNAEDNVHVAGLFTQLDSTSPPCEGVVMPASGGHISIYDNGPVQWTQFTAGGSYHWEELSYVSAGGRCFMLVVQGQKFDFQDYTEAQPFLLKLGDIVYIGGDVAYKFIVLDENAGLYGITPVKIVLGGTGIQIAGQLPNGSTDCTQAVIFCMRRVASPTNDSFLVWAKQPRVQGTFTPVPAQVISTRIMTVAPQPTATATKSG